jgi:hypothetical protein
MIHPLFHSPPPLRVPLVADTLSRMKTRLPAAAAALGLLVIPVAALAALKSNLTREKGAIYVEDFSDTPVKLRVKAPAPVYNNLLGERSLGVLVPDQMATLVAFTERACRVRARAGHGDVVGWVRTALLESKDPEFFDKMRRVAERQRQVQELISRKEVAIGMTPEEVIEALGKPDMESSRTDANSQLLTFEYITYDRVPQRTLARDRFGRLYNTITYIKVETGRFTVHFDDGAVSSIETTKGEPKFNNSKIVVPPINIY